jgi:glycosyltransferase involved in cell wall biosynthesis
LEQLKNGSAARVHVEEIAQNLRSLGWQVDVYAPAYRQANPPLLFRLPHFVLIQLRLAASWRPGDVIYVRAHMMAFLIAVFAWLRRATIVHEVNGSYADAFVAHANLRPVSFFLCLMQRWQYRRASNLIGVTPGLVSWLRSEARHDRVSLVSNGANTDLFHSNAVAAEFLPEGRYVIFAGGLAEWHGLDVMIAAAGHNDWPQDVSLLILGGCNATKNAGLFSGESDNVIFAGCVAYERVPSYLCKAIAGLVPLTDPAGRSKTGLAPLKVFEFLACGIPVIVSDLPGLTELVSAGRCGLVVPPENPAALARAVRNLADDPAKAATLGSHGASIVLTSYSWKRAAKQVDGILEQALKVSRECASVEIQARSS